MTRYRDDMPANERDALLAECDALDAAYAGAAAHDEATRAAAAAAAGREPDAEELDAAVESSLDYFNRYIAGDRRTS